jgi:hypothetical protein
MMDLSVALTAAMDVECLKLLYRLLRPQLKSGDDTLQKKSYKALHFVLSGTSADHQAFVAEHLADIAVWAGGIYPDL